MPNTLGDCKQRTRKGERMKYNMRHIIFWVTIACVSLSILRRPLVYLYFADKSPFLNPFLVPFADILWLFNCEWIINFQEMANPNGVAVVGFLCGMLASMIVHLVIAAAMCGAISNAWEWCNEVKSD